MIEISTDSDGTVYARWSPGGPWTSLANDGSIGQDALGGRVEWVEYEEPDDTQGDYDDGFDDGFEAATDAAQDAINSLTPSSHRTLKAVASK